MTVVVEPGGERTFLIDTVQNARTHTMTDTLTLEALDGVDAIHVSGHALIRDSDPIGAGEQIATLREELEDLNEYLDVTEARVRDEGKPRLTHDEVKKRYGVK